MMEASTVGINITNSTSYTESDSTLTDVINILTLIISVVGVTLNLLSIIAFAHTPKDFRIQSKLIVSLSVSDMLIVAATLIHELMNDLLMQYPCFSFIKMLLVHTSYLATLLNLAAMALYLYIYTTHVYAYQNWITNFKTNCIVLLVWVISISVAVSEVFVGAIILDPDENSTSSANYNCFKFHTDEYETDHFIIYVIFIVTFIIIIAYINIAYTGFQMRRQDMLYNRNTNVNKNKTILTTGLFIFTFVFTWIPYGTFHMVTIYKTYAEMSKNLAFYLRVNHILQAFFLLNSIADPVIYALRLKKVRKGYKLFFNRILKLFLIFPKLKRFNDRAYRLTERRQTLSTTLSGQDWLKPEDGSPTMINHESNSNRNKESITTGETALSDMTLQRQDSMDQDNKLNLEHQKLNHAQ